MSLSDGIAYELEYEEYAKSGTVGPVRTASVGPNTQSISRDQRNKADAGKTNPLLLEEDLAKPLAVVNRVLDYGAEKYERGGWKKVEPERYKEALRRHLRAMAIDGDLSFDNESGLLHLAHMVTNGLFLMHFIMEQNFGVDFLTYQKPPQDHKN